MYVGLVLFIVPLTMLVFFKTGDSSSTQPGVWLYDQTEDIESRTTRCGDVVAPQVCSRRRRWPTSWSRWTVWWRRESVSSRRSTRHWMLGPRMQSRLTTFGVTSCWCLPRSPLERHHRACQWNDHQIHAIFILDLLRLSPDKVQIVCLPPLMIMGATIALQHLSKLLEELEPLCWQEHRHVATSRVIVPSTCTSSTLVRGEQGHEQHPWYCSVPSIWLSSSSEQS